MRFDSRFLPWVLLAIVGGAWLSFAAIRHLRGWLRRLDASRRLRRARRGERDAEPLLMRAGYTIVGRQVSGAHRLHVDGEIVEIPLRADLMVTRCGRRYVAEVKTGKRAPRVEHAETRRQLVEYRIAFDVDGALLVDMERGRIHEVEPRLPQSTAASAKPLAVGVVIGVSVGFMLGVLASR